MSKKLILCDCLGSQKVDADSIAKATGLDLAPTLNDACGSQVQTTADVMSKGEVTIACQQQARFFDDLADEIDCSPPDYVDIRDRAGWARKDQDASPKMAALIAEGVLPSTAEKTLDIVSAGTCLIMGAGEVAHDAASQLSQALSVTLLTSQQPDGSAPFEYDTICGKLRKIGGTLGQFELEIDGFQQQIAGGRGDMNWTEPRDGAVSECDIVVDLTGEAPLFPAPDKRDGYLRADPKRPQAVTKAVLSAAQMTGTFEKPLYVRLEESLCAHSRAEKPACSKCLNACPTGAITPAGDHVAIDPRVCAGCGACSAVCPSGAISYDAPPVSDLFKRLETLARTYRLADGLAPRLLVHDKDFGAEMIALAARYGDGLPADVIPLAVPALAGFGHAEMLAALACGFSRISVLLPPKAERDVTEQETRLATTIAGRNVIDLIDTSDPDELSASLYSAEELGAVANHVLPIGSRRQVTRLAAKALRPSTAITDLPTGAPYGAVLVDTNACTLCLACVSLCPSGALVDNPDLPQLRFQEDACLQCGLCSNICPEHAIELQPRLNLTDGALAQAVLHEEEPFACIDCGTLFGVKSTVERIMQKLSGQHQMFATNDALRMIQMCDGCRVQAQFHATNSPFASADRPRVRTTEDYLSKSKPH
ncbi:MAG: 4Fe-4S binding protein [Pseudomonadota bacterium]